jgi:geranylgeranyl pyrophosphate synthase
MGRLHITENAKLVVWLITNPKQVLRAPAEYVGSLPSKGVRDKIADALSIWLDVPAQDLSQIKRVINLLHNASLMFDDVEDGSKLRRAHPTTHNVFGVAQTINSAGHQIIEAMKEVNKLHSAQCFEIFTRESFFRSHPMHVY